MQTFDKCPVCGCDELDGDTWENESGETWQRVACLGDGCGASWIETYTASHREYIQDDHGNELLPDEQSLEDRLDELIEGWCDLAGAFFTTDDARAVLLMCARELAGITGKELHDGNE